MPAISRKRRAPTEDEDDIPTPTQKQRNGGLQAETPVDEDDEIDEAEEEGEGSGSIAQLSKALVRYALACEYSRTPIKRPEVAQKVLGTHTRKFRAVFEAANSQLMDVFGMQMEELAKSENVTMKQKKRAVASEGASKSTNTWVLKNILPDQYRTPDIINPGREPPQEEPDVEAAYTGFCTVVISLICLSEGRLSDGKLDRYLRRLNADQKTPMDSTEKVLLRMAKEGYIIKIKESSNGEETVDYMVGPRGKIQVDMEAVADFVRAMFGTVTEDLEQRLKRSLRLGDDEGEGETNGELEAPAVQSIGETRPAAASLVGLFPPGSRRPCGVASQCLAQSIAPARNAMSSIDSLLNHEPSGERRPSQPLDFAPPNFEAADALTALATLGSGQQYATTRELPEPAASFAHPPPRPRSFSSHAEPVEPSPPLELPQSHSPTLAQYHHGSKSPEEQRRQSLIAHDPEAPVLAPIQNLSSSLQSRIDETHTLGQDVSQMVSPPPHDVDANVARDETQDREPAFVRDEPTTAQIREPESMHNTPDPISTAIPPAQTTEQVLSPLTAVKNEPAGGSRGATPITAPQAERQQSVTSENIDVETRKAIEIAKQSDLGLRVKRNASIAESVTSPTEPKPAPSKKRPAPGAVPTIKKKGTATTKKPSKKRKLDTDSDAHARSVTPTSRPSKTASSKNGKKGSQAGTPVAESSPAPDHSSQVHPSDDEGDSSEDTTLYCICKKPDNHRWMIGCDGGCDDWFHGSCINMAQADEELVDKFICPLCEEKGRGQTTWKPMCRRNGCRKPARLTKGKESKYCSDECGALFFTEQLQRTAGAKNANSKSKKPKKKSGKNSEEAASDDDDEPTPLGGVLRAKDLKALLEPCKDIQAFKALGSGVLSPPRTASPTKDTFNGANGRPAEDLSLTAGETERLNALFKEKSQLKDRLEVLNDREKFVSMAKEQATRVAEREKIKVVKEFCGYDSRLSWSDAEFLRWRNSKHGLASFKFSTLSPTPEQIAEVDGEDITMADAEDSDAERVCLKKRCSKHPQWQKLNLQDARFEELEIAQSIKECEKEERSVRERARRRAQKEEMAKEVMGGESDGNAGVGRNREGWVEMVEAQ
ncbi:MAGE-domain-containing protein [Massarina eburnea CBS 473.64]|uniref:MAGE-domain-containing protein n=1 Tax=Massarina eburnea CBS 473.64 TaxID=1395130 RepID=A0A6A6RQ41_9PLEO|nr:MAGE-domain-containing protein [Massarina eburnea CBS 473.64]